MFRCDSNHTIDDKGRIIVPARFRSVIAESGENAVMLAKLDDCLYGYTLPQWRIIEEKVVSMPETTTEFRRFRRFLIGGAAECKLDKQDRILIPPTLREYAALEDEVVLMGLLNHFEIWSRKRLDMDAAQLERDKLASPEFAKQVNSLGL